MARIPLVSRDALSAEQQPVYERIVHGLGSPLVGPLRAVLHIPELADRWQNLGQYWQHHTVLTALQKEIATLVTARRWNAHIVWHQHAQRARKAGLDESVMEALRVGAVPVFHAKDDQAVYEYARELQIHGQVSVVTYQAALDAIGRDGVIDLTAVIGFYTMVSMTVNAHQIPLLGGEPEPLPVEDKNALADLPSSQATHSDNRN